MSRKLSLILVLTLFIPISGMAQKSKLDELFPVRGLAIEAPPPAAVDSFVTFIDQELAPKNINTLILRVDFSYEFKSRPELRDSLPLSNADIKKFVAVAKKNNIRLIPQINLLGHQSCSLN